MDVCLIQFTNLKQQVQVYQGTGTGLSKYRFIKVQVQVQVYYPALALWGGPSATLISIFCDFRRLFFVLTTVISYENKFFMTICLIINQKANR